MRFHVVSGRYLKALPLAIVACALVAGYAGSTAQSAGRACANVSFGIFGPLTGTSGSYGQTGLQAAKLAVADFAKKHGGCTVKIVQYDSQGDPAQAPALARKAIEDSSVIAIDGPSFSGESQAADPIFNAAGLPAVTASATNKDLSHQGWKIFHRTVVTDGQEGPAEAQYLVKTMHFKKIAVIDNGQAYGKGLGDDVATALKKLGAKVVDRESVDANGSDYSSTINKIRAAKPDVVYCGCLDPEAARLVKQLRAAGDTTPYSGGAGLQTANFIKEAGKAAAQGTIVGSGGIDASQSKSGRAFLKHWRATLHTTPGLYAVEYYNAATAILNAVGAGKTSRSDVNAYIGKEKFNGPTGLVAFASNGDVKNAKVNFYTVAKGSFKFRGSIVAK